MCESLTKVSMAQLKCKATPSIPQWISHIVPAPAAAVTQEELRSYDQHEELSLSNSSAPPLSLSLNSQIRWEGFKQWNEIEQIHKKMLLCEHERSTDQMCEREFHIYTRIVSPSLPAEIMDEESAGVLIFGSYF